MTLAQKIAHSSAINRMRQRRAEARLDEQLLVAEARDQVDEFTTHDATSDMKFRAAIRRLYKTLDTDEQRELCALVYSEWDGAESEDDVILRDHADHIDRTRFVLYANTPLFTDPEGPSAA